MPPQQIEHSSIEERLVRIERDVKATKKYVLIMLIGVVATAVLPLILGAIAVPFLMSTMGSVYGI